MSLGNVITLATDASNNNTPANEDYSFYSLEGNRSVYIGDGYDPASRDVISFTRTFNKRSGNFKGVGKSTVKLTKDVTVTGVDATTTITAPIIIEVSFSVPVGADPGSLMRQRQRAIALLDLDDLMNKLAIQLQV